MNPKDMLDIRKREKYSKSVMGKEITQIAEDLCEELGKELECQVKFSFLSYEDSMFGMSDNDLFTNKNTRMLYLGCAEMITKKLDHQIFTNSLIVLFHEVEHFNQLIDIKNGKACEEILFSNLATHDNEFYELNYRHFYTEYDAEHIGVVQAYNYITLNYKEIDAVECIKNYFIEKKNVYGNYMSEIISIKTIEDIENLFDSYLNDIKNTIKSVKCSTKGSPVHEFFDAMRSNPQIYDQREGITSGNVYIESCNNNLDSDKFVSMIILNKHPEFINYYPEKAQEVIRKLSLSYFIQAAIHNREMYHEKQYEEREDI